MIIRVKALVMNSENKIKGYELQGFMPDYDTWKDWDNYELVDERRVSINDLLPNILDMVLVGEDIDLFDSSAIIMADGEDTTELPRDYGVKSMLIVDRRFMRSDTVKVEIIHTIQDFDTPRGKPYSTRQNIKAVNNRALNSLIIEHLCKEINMERVLG